MPETTSSKQPIISTKNLSVLYFLGKPNQVNALVDANIEIFPGEFIIFFGPSGCGKSTLLYSIAGLEQGIQGDIFIDGKNLAKFTLAEMEYHHRKKMGMIFQAYHLINTLNVLKNVTLPQLSLGIRIKEREEKAKALLDKFGVIFQLGKFPNELSGGQQQRVAISRALINDPDIILADEPTGNLDSKTAILVMDLLRDLNEEMKKTVILVTHSPQFLHYAHRIFYMKDGHVISVKTNRYVGQKDKIREVGLDVAGAAPPMTKELELLARTYTSLTPEKTGDALLAFKAQEIVSEALTDMTAEEIGVIEKKVEEMLKKRIESDELLEYLDDDFELGGLGMDRRAAQKLFLKIKDIVGEIKVIRKEDAERSGKIKDGAMEGVREIRHYLFDVFDVSVRNFTALERVNSLIKARLVDKVGIKDVQKGFDLPIKDGGAGIDKRKAYKMAKRLELLMLGKYQEPRLKVEQPLKQATEKSSAFSKNNNLNSTGVPATKEPKKDGGLLISVTAKAKKVAWKVADLSKNQIISVKNMTAEKMGKVISLVKDTVLKKGESVVSLAKKILEKIKRSK